MLLRFTKMHGLGNDFMVIDLLTQRAHIQPRHIRQWADRHTGIGFDQLLLVEAPDRPDVDFRYRIFNADGSEVEQCGNGARCFARFVLDKHLTVKKSILVQTLGGIIELNLLPNGEVRVNMGEPRLESGQIPFISDHEAVTHCLDIGQQRIELSVVSMGNPHAVLLVEDVDTAPVATLGPALETHSRFPQKANIGFLQIIDPHHARLRVWERGVGETQACGTGACAAVVAAIRQNRLRSPAHIDLPGGRLSIDWKGPGHPVLMTGPAVRVYEGHVRL